MTFYVLARDAKATGEYRRLYHDSSGLLYVWLSEKAAWEFARNEKSHQTWIARKSVRKDFQLAAKYSRNFNRVRYRQPLYKIIDADKEPLVAKKKVTSSGMLVDVFEDYENRRFAIASKAESEDEFIVEISQALASENSPDWNTRLKELLPLMIDICCKYRGYKAENVHERRELVAGDLEMPIKNPSNEIPSIT